MSTKYDPLGELALQPGDHIVCVAGGPAGRDLHLDGRARVLEQHQTGMSGDGNRRDIQIKILDQAPARMDGGIDRDHSCRSSFLQDVDDPPVAIGHINAALRRQLRLGHIPIEDKDPA
jgi:hypothetical protein